MKRMFQLAAAALTTLTAAGALFFGVQSANAQGRPDLPPGQVPKCLEDCEEGYLACLGDDPTTGRTNQCARARRDCRDDCLGE
jgi:hypothetical protein